MPNPSLPVDVVDFVERIVCRCSWRRKVRREVRRELLAHFEDALEGAPEEDRPEAVQTLINKFGEPAIVAKLIHRGKQRCRPLWEKVVGAAAACTAISILSLFLFAAIASNRVESKYKETVQRLQAEGSLRTASQLQSTRPAGTVFFDGPDDACAISRLLAFKLDESWAYTAKELVDSLAGLSVEKEQEIRTLVSSRETDLAQLRHIADLPGTPMDQALRVVGFKNSLVGTRYPGEALHYVYVMILNAFVLLQDGHEDEALAESDRVLSIAAHFRDIPILNWQVIAAACERKTASVLAPISRSSRLSSSAINTFAKDWQPEGNREALAQSLEMESESLRWGIHDSGWPMSKIVYTQHSPWRQRLLSRFYLNSIGRLISGPEEMNYYEHTGKVADCAREPFFEARREAVCLLDRELNFRRKAKIGLLPSPEFIDIVWFHTTAETQLTQARVALALNQYKSQTGRYPSKLDALVPGFLNSIPVDPFSGKKMSYSLREAQYCLYSVGNNKSDKEDDIIWGLPPGLLDRTRLSASS